MLNAKPKKALILALVATVGLAGCTRQPEPTITTVASSDVNCMARAMYFESNRSSRDGMIAVGSVLMNRVQSDDFPDTVCAVVSQKNQFAPGVMTKSMNDQGRALALASASAVLTGERHPKVSGARFFHAAWYTANFNNIHYVLTAGGNAFYEKRRPEDVTSPNPLPQTEGITG
ncbi:spore germination cell wall hydrolase CwlJ-like protein [Loktanella ponticola]|uniref:Spore germination cell wall hydrolase CwlJ-like protein n=1 Tax=Yoonia ponticola TaxID=1524255 RepID=A0A7W9F0R6_9RHOB|nr:cell wall hydrolase [Yoonia ponticola]MBB5723221.1 spore germination cell wall hydrolase CwlJ-like protein [Yoonia ponticola]